MYRDAIETDGKRRRQIFLYRDLAVQLLIIGKIGDAEAALSEHGLDAIAADDGARRKRHELLR